MPLDPETIRQLLKEDKTPQGRKPVSIIGSSEFSFPKVEQQGPLRFHDNPRKCISARCGVQTWMTVDGIPYCSVHSLQELNNMAIRLTKRIEESFKHAKTTVIGEL